MMRLVIPVASFLCLGVTLTATMSTTRAQETVKSPDGRGLRGFVCGPEREPLPNATVLVNMRKTTTREDGTFFLAHDQLERQGPTLILLVHKLHQGKRLSSSRFVDYVTGQENVTIRLWCNASISGQVISPDRTPIDGANVSALMNVGAFTCHGTIPVGAPVVTDSKGRFTLTDLYPHTRYRLRIRCPGRERKLTEWVNVGTQELCDTLRLVLRDAPGNVTGRVVDEKGVPVAEARVILGHPCIPDAVSITEPDGTFKIDDLIPGDEISLSVDWNFHKVEVGSADVVLTAGRRKP